MREGVRRGDGDRTNVVNPDWYLGVFGGYARNEGRSDGFGSSLILDGGYFGVSAQTQRGAWFANFVGSFGFHDLGTVRRDLTGSTFRGDTDATQGVFFAQTGWDLVYGNEGNGKITPYAGFSASALGVDGYTESGPGAALRFADETTVTTQTSLGVNVSGYSEFERGWIRPSVDLAWWHAFDDDNGYGVGLAAPGLLNSFEVLTNDVNGDRLVIQAGGEFGFGTSEAWTFNAGYLGVYGGDGYTSHGGSFGAQVEF